MPTKTFYREQLTVTVANAYVATMLFIPGSRDFCSSNHGITRNNHAYGKSIGM